MSDIITAVQKLEKLCQNGETGKLQAEIFSEDVILCGEGAPGIVHGEGPVRDTIAAILKITPKLSIRIHKSQIISQSVIATWLDWSSPSEEGLIKFRSLTIWKKVDNSWQIVSDMYGLGSF